MYQKANIQWCIDKESKYTVIPSHDKSIYITDKYFYGPELHGDSLTLHKIGLTYIFASSELHVKQEYTSALILLKIADRMADLSVSVHPVTGLMRDIIEFATGKDVWTHENLTTFGRIMATFGVVTGGFATKPVAVIKAFQKIERLTQGMTKLELEQMRKLDWDKSLSEIKETVAFVKKHRVYTYNDRKVVEVANAFMKNSKVRVLKEDLVVYRYYDPIYSEARGVWVTTNGNLANPEMDLALKHSGNYIAKKWIIPKGTEILEGIVAPNFGKPGGACQILVNMEFLR